MVTESRFYKPSKSRQIVDRFFLRLYITLALKTYSALFTSCYYFLLQKIDSLSFDQSCMYLGLNAQPDIQTLTGLLWHITSLEIASSRHSE